MPSFDVPEAESRELHIYLDAQAFEYIEDGHIVSRGLISAGRKEHPTPRGSFSVLSKQKNKVSSKYTNAFGMLTPMPYSMQFYGHYFVHEGWLPGHPASHGCVRVRYEDAKFLFERMKVGDLVTVRN
ncbi:MAG: L,D-transpeptidase [Pseudomonadota bacterium]|nr:L,D-transpeptidase [Pseudomonadota bacterium]